MQRVDGFFQYQNHFQTGQSVQSTAAEGTGTVSKELQQLPKGTVFEGTITDVKDGLVQLKLSNGQSIRAQLEPGVQVRMGEPVLFEVKSNQEGRIMLRQVPVNSQFNPTLSRALSAAGLPVNQRNLDLVDLLMKNQLPINRESLTGMMRQLLRYPDAQPQTLIQMEKLGFPLNAESVAQFEAYKAGEHALVDRFSQLMEQLPELIGTGNDGAGRMIELQNQLLDLLEVGTGGGALQEGTVETMQGADGSVQGAAGGMQNADRSMQGAVGGIQGTEANAQGAAGNLQGQGAAVGSLENLTIGGSQTAMGEGLAAGDGMASAGGNAAAVGEGIAGGSLASALGTAGTLGEGAALVGGSDPSAVLADGASVVQGSETGAVLGNETSHAGRPETLGEFLSQTDLKSLGQQLKQLPGMEADGRIFSQGELNRNLNAGELLNYIRQNLSAGGEMNAAAVKELFKGKEYKSLLKQVMSEQWLLEPEQVAKKDQVEQLYERINRQMAKLEQFLQNAGKEVPAANRQVSQVRGNLELMNQINQLYNYVQLPLKLHGQNAHSDLYVYTNKKKLQDAEGELSALLHLELDHLGTTDVQVKLLGNGVTANFFLSDELALRLVEQHVEELTERLEQKGYRCSVQLEQQVKEMDFVEDFLEREAPVGQLSRYSFDVLT